MNNGHESGEEKIRTMINKGLESAKEVIEEQAAKLKDKVGDLELREVPDEVRAYVRKSPWKSVAIALGLGFLVGYLIKSNRD